MKNFLMIAALLAPMFASAQEVRYTVTLMNEPAVSWDGNTPFTAKTAKQERLVVVEKHRDRKALLFATVSTVAFDRISDDAGTSIQQPVLIDKANQCEIAVGETCVAVAADGKQLYAIKRVQ